MPGHSQHPLAGEAGRHQGGLGHFVQGIGDHDHDGIGGMSRDLF